METQLINSYNHFLYNDIESAFENGVVWFGELEAFVKANADEFVREVEDDFPETSNGVLLQWFENRLKQEDWDKLFDDNKPDETEEEPEVVSMIDDFQMLERKYKEWLEKTLQEPICMEQTSGKDLKHFASNFVEHVIDDDVRLSFATVKRLYHAIENELKDDAWNSIELVIDHWYFKRLEYEDWDALAKKN